MCDICLFYEFVGIRVSGKSYSPVKKPKIGTPVVIRRSLRTRGMPPDSEGLKGIELESGNGTEKSLPSPAEVKGPLSMRDAYEGEDEFDHSFVESIVGLAKKEGRKSEDKAWCPLKLESMTLDLENTARIVPSRITNVRFFHSSCMRMVVAGDKLGNIGFWDCDSGRNEGNEVHLYHPHPAPISGILVQRHCLSKVCMW